MNIKIPKANIIELSKYLKGFCFKITIIDGKEYKIYGKTYKYNADSNILKILNTNKLPVILEIQKEYFITDYTKNYDN